MNSHIFLNKNQVLMPWKETLTTYFSEELMYLKYEVKLHILEAHQTRHKQDCDLPHQAYLGKMMN